MGISATGYVFYGWVIGETPDINHNQYNGWLNIHQTPSDLDEEGWEPKPEHDRYCFGAEENLLVVDTHGHTDYPQYHITHRAMIYTGDQYDPDEFELPNSSDMDGIKDQIIEMAKAKGFDMEDLGEPKLYLTAYYG